MKNTFKYLLTLFLITTTANAGGPFLWGPTGATDLQSGLVIPGSTSGTFSLFPNASTTSYSWTLPAIQGGASTFLQNDGSGNLTWASPSGSPGGVSTNIQYNNAGSFGGNGSFTYNGSGTVTATTFVGALTGHGSLDLPLAGGTMSGVLNMGTNQITNVVDPTTAQMAATKNYVDTVSSSLQPIQAVSLASASVDYPGAMVGNVLTITATGAISIDGSTPSTGSRVLLKDQSTQSQNGVYTVTTVGSLGVAPVLTRASDYNTAAEVDAGDLIPVIGGTVNTQTSWLQTATVVTLNTDSLIFVQWTANPSSYLVKANNLSDVGTKATAFNNISPMTTLGDIPYGGASGAGTRLPGNTTTVQNVLTQTGTGSVSAAPVWTPVSAIGISTDWASCDTLTIGAVTTPPTKGTTTTDECRYRRVGDTMEFDYTLNMSGAGSAGSGTYLLPIPNSLVLDTTKATVSTNVIGAGGTNLGGGYITNTASANSSGAAKVHVVAYDTTHLQVITETSTVWQANAWNNSWYGLNSGGLYASIHAFIPIVGWSSSTIGSGQGSVVASYYLSTNQSTTSSYLKYDTKIIDTNSIYSTSTGLSTIPVTGNYTICASGTATAGNTLTLQKNAALYSYLVSVATAGTNVGCLTLPLNASDTVGVYPNANGTFVGNSTLSAGNGTNYFTLNLVAGGNGNVAGPGSSTSGHIATFNNTAGTSIQDSGVAASGGVITTGTWNGTVTAGNSFVTSGVTYTTPANITVNTQFKFTLIGGGGAGGGCAASTGDKGAGGGAGGTAIVFTSGLTASTAYTVAIGSSGAGSSNANGGSGGNTTLTIGATTYTASGGTGGTKSSGGAGGVGGGTTNATLSIPGQNGGQAAGVNASVASPSGGSSMFGLGGASVYSSVSSIVGASATGYGGGGGGAIAGSSSFGANAGGPGSPGAILVEWSN